ncbi:MAG: LCP family protein [Anaerolineales bacterium]
MKKIWGVVKQVLKWTGVALLVLTAAGVVFLAVIWRRPLGPALELPTLTITQAETERPSETAQLVKNTGTPESTATELLPTNTPTPEPICGGPPSMLILAVGIDYRPDSYLYGLADMIRIIKADFVNLTISSIDIPRAIEVDIPDLNALGLARLGTPTGALNQSYFWGTEGMQYSDVPGFGAGLLARTLEVNFGVRVENYIVVNMATLANAIDAIGGVPIYVYQTIDDRQRDTLPALPIYGYFSAGNHWLNGTEAVRYARIRSIGGIYGRHDRQNEVLVQLQKRIMDPSIVSAIPDLIESFYGNVRTDLSLEQLFQLSCLSLKLSLDDIHFVGMPPEIFVEGRNFRGDSVLYTDHAVIRELISDFLLGDQILIHE